MGQSDEHLKKALESLQARDRVQTGAILGYGVDLSRERVIDLTFISSDQAAADQLAAALQRNGLSKVRVSTSSTSSPGSPRWFITCSLSASVNFITEKENIATFMLIADKYDCQYDGWGTAIVEVLERPPASD